MTVLILCAGEASRFGGGLKQLLAIGKETILDRIQRQVRERGRRPLVVTHRKEIQNRAADWIVPEKHSCTCATLRSTQRWWGERTIVLLGDVIYSKWAMDMILAQKWPLAFIGDPWEIYALSFLEQSHERLLSGLDMAIGKSNGKLGTLHGILIDKPETQSSWNARMTSPIFIHVRDWTRDVDSQKEYVDACIELVSENQLDDL